MVSFTYRRGFQPQEDGLTDSKEEMPTCWVVHTAIEDRVSYQYGNVTFNKLVLGDEDGKFKDGGVSLQTSGTLSDSSDTVSVDSIVKAYIDSQISAVLTEAKDYSDLQISAIDPGPP